tara:strand:- start:338 stop:466 length:129 start_codon:yes stop_codon:yes gene_type:complete
VDKDEEEMDMINLGKRQRTNLYNTDNLTEAQFIKAIEDGMDY